MSELFLQFWYHILHDRKNGATVLIAALKYVNECHCMEFWSSSALWIATVMCHEIPRFANQSVWLSLYFLGRNFMAQSWTRSTDVWFSMSSASVRASSWLTFLRRCALHACIACFAWLVTNVSSSVTSPLLADIWEIASSMLFSTVLRFSQRSQMSRCLWLHSVWNSASLGSLRA